MKGTIRTIIVAAAIMTSGSALAAGDRLTRDLEFIIERDARVTSPGHPGVSGAPRSSSETAILAAFAIRLYQVTLSAQDTDACNFTPSCSRFTLAAIRSGGIVRGVLLGADRLTRCHRLSSAQYSGDRDGADRRARIYDPTDWYIH